MYHNGDWRAQPYPGRDRTGCSKVFDDYSISSSCESLCVDQWAFELLSSRAVGIREAGFRAFGIRPVVGSSIWRSTVTFR